MVCGDHSHSSFRFAVHTGESALHGQTFHRYVYRMDGNRRSFLLCLYGTEERFVPGRKGTHNICETRKINAKEIGYERL